MKKTEISFGITLQLIGVLAAGFLMTSAVFAQTSGEVGGIPDALQSLAEELGCNSKVDCEAAFSADPARGIDLATKHNVYDENQLELAQTFKSQVLDELSNIDPATIHEKIIEIAERLVRDNPALAERFSVQPKKVDAARTIVNEVKSAGADLSVCSKSADSLTRTQLISCLNASKKLAGQRDTVSEYVSADRIAITDSKEFDDMLLLQEALDRGEYNELNAQNAEELGIVCLRPGSPKACDDIAARFFGPEGVAELARARAQVSTVEAQYKKGADSFTLTTPSGKKITGKENIRRACEEAFSTKNIQLARACGDFAIKNGLASPEDVSEGIGFLESIGATNIDLNSCRKNPDACSQFIPEDRRNNFNVMRQIEDIMAAEIGFDPSECEQGGFNPDIGNKCLEGAKRALPRIRALATTPEAQRIVSEIEGHIAEGERMQNREGEFDEVFRTEGGPGGCQSAFECYAYCSDSTHGPECVAWGASQGVFQGEEAVRRYEEFNTRISAPASIQFDNNQLRPEPTRGPQSPAQPRPGQVPLFPSSQPNSNYYPPPTTDPDFSVYNRQYSPGPGPVGPSPECFEAIQLGDFAKAKVVCKVSSPVYENQPYPQPYPYPGPDIDYPENFGPNPERMIEDCVQGGGTREDCRQRVNNYLSGNQPDASVKCNQAYKDQASCNQNPSCSWQGNYCQSNFCPRTFAPPPQCSTVDPSLHDGTGKGPRGCAVCTLTYREPKQVEKSTCPALPSVNQCGPNENKIVTFQSEACGVYYGCQPKLTTTKIPANTQFPYTFSNGVLVKTADEARGYCYTNPPGSGQGVAAECENRFGISYGAGPDPLPPGAENWVDKTWTFSDGSSVYSSILNRTDTEYRNHIRDVEAKCKTIPQSRFSWRSNAGDSRASNWQNFGIPDCSGSGGQVYGDCRINSSKPSCYAQPGCRWFTNPDGFEYCEGDNFVPPAPKCSSYFQELRCSTDFSCEWKTPPLGGIGWCQVKTYVAPKTSDACSGVGAGWHEEYREAGQVVCFNENHDQYKIGNNATKSCIATSRAGCYNSPISSPSSSTPPPTYVPPTGTNYTGDAYSCPSFAFSKWDKNGSRYCQLNSEKSCNYTYPEYLEQRNYYSGNCPPEAPVYGDCRANLDQNKCYDQPGCIWFATSVTTGYCEGDNYVPPMSTTPPPYVPPTSTTPTTSSNTTVYTGTPSSSNWVNHTWNFKDGSTQFSSILNRTDTEYKNFIATVDTETAKGYFGGWSPGGGDQSKWKEFGIPIVLYSPPPAGTSPSYPGYSSGGSTLRNCWYDNASRNGQPFVDTRIWCESDYYNCHFDSPTGTVATLDNLSLGAPSSCESGSISGGTGSYPSSGDIECQSLESIIPGCHYMSESPNVRFNGSMTQYVTVGTTAVKNCSSASIPGCSSSGGYYPPSSGGSGLCSDQLLGLLGSGCHDMGNAWFDGPMNKYVYPGTTAVKDCSTEWTSGCSGGSGGYYPPSSGGSGLCSDQLLGLLGSGCHDMGNAWFDGAMNNYVYPGTSAVKSCSTEWTSGCSGGSGDGGYVPPSGGSCPQYGFGSPDGSYACNYNTCSNGCNFDSQGCPISCYASSGGSAPSGGDPQTECANYGGTWDSANNFCNMPGGPPPGGPPPGSDPGVDCANAGGSWDAASNTCNMPPQARLRNQNLLGQVNIALAQFGRFIGRLFWR
jgi:hypothetical protein